MVHILMAYNMETIADINIVTIVHQWEVLYYSFILLLSSNERTTHFYWDINPLHQDHKTLNIMAEPANLINLSYYFLIEHAGELQSLYILIIANIGFYLPC